MCHLLLLTHLFILVFIYFIRNYFSFRYVRILFTVFISFSFSLFSFFFRMNKFLLSTTFFCFVFLKYNLFNFLTILINRKIILIRRNLGICGSCRYFLLSESYGVENGTPDCRTLGYALATIIYRHGPELRGTGWQWLAFNAGGVWLTTPHLSAVTECVCVWSNDCAVAAAF